MAIVIIGNTYSTIENATNNELRIVDKALAVLTPGYQFVPRYQQGFWDGYTRFFRMGSKKFPTGLISIVVKSLMAKGHHVDIEDNREYFMDAVIPQEIELLHAELGSITLRDYQLEAVRKGMDETRGVINVATNGGKTEIACGMMKYILKELKPGQTIAFFTHAKEIFYQSHKRISERLGVEVGLIGDEIWDEKQINVIMIPTVTKYLKVPKEVPKSRKRTALIKKIGQASGVEQKALEHELKTLDKETMTDIKEKVKKTDKLFKSITAFIADEVHHASSYTWYDIFMSLNNAYYRFGLTGTVDDSDEINLFRLYGCTGKITTRISNEFLIKNGYSAKPTIHLLKFNTKKIHSTDYREIYEDGIMYNDARNMAFVNEIEKRANSGDQCLIIVAETTHGELVQGLLIDKGLDPVFIHGEKTAKTRTGALESFKNGDIRVLVATTILDEGVDVPSINCLFLMAGGKSSKNLLQRVGRGVRKKSDGSGVAVFDAVDDHNRLLKLHYNKRVETYKEEKFEMVYKNVRED